MAPEILSGSLELGELDWGAKPAWLLAAGGRKQPQPLNSELSTLRGASPEIGWNACLLRQLWLIISALCCFAVNAQALDPSVPAAQMTPVTCTVAAPPMPVFDVRKFGAKGDGKTYDTLAIQSAVDACAGTGGSVVLSRGSYLTAQLQLKGGMTFYIDRSAVLLGGTDPADYPVLAPSGPARGMVAFACRRSILYANQADHLIIDGGGTIDGQCKLVRMSGPEPDRPSLLRIFQSNGVAVRNVMMKNPRMWTQFYDNANGIKIGTMTKGPIENIRIVNNTIRYARLGGLCLESILGSVMKNVLVQGLDIHKTGQPIFIRLGPRNPHLPGGISSIAIERVRILETHRKTAPACTITGMAGVNVRGVRLKDMYVEMPGGMTEMPGRPPEMNQGEYPQSNIFGHTPGYAFYVRYADGIVFENVTIRAVANDVRPWLATEYASVQTINCVEVKGLQAAQNFQFNRTGK